MNSKIVVLKKIATDFVDFVNLHRWQNISFSKSNNILMTCDKNRFVIFVKFYFTLWEYFKKTIIFLWKYDFIDS